jgi:hypothetical protein
MTCDEGRARLTLRNPWHQKPLIAEKPTFNGWIFLEPFNDINSSWANGNQPDTPMQRACHDCPLRFIRQTF